MRKNELLALSEKELMDTLGGYAPRTDEGKGFLQEFQDSLKWW